MRKAVKVLRDEGLIRTVPGWGRTWPSGSGVNPLIAVFFLGLSLAGRALDHAFATAIELTNDRVKPCRPLQAGSASVTGCVAYPPPYVSG